MRGRKGMKITLITLVIVVAFGQSKAAAVTSPKVAEEKTTDPSFSKWDRGDDGTRINPNDPDIHYEVVAPPWQDRSAAATAVVTS